MILFSKANKGASGNAATKIVMKPNCITKGTQVNQITVLYTFIIQIEKFNGSGD